MKLWASILVLLLLNFKSLCAQNKWKFAIPANIDAGFSLSTVSVDKNSDWFVGFNKNLLGRSGIGCIYDKKFGAYAEAGVVLNTVSFNNVAQQAEYSISSITLSSALNAFALIPIDKKHATYLHTGANIGFTHQGNDSTHRQNNGYMAVSKSFGPRSLTLAPELGITHFEKKLSVSLLATYSYQFNTGTTFQTTIIDNYGSITAKSKGDYLAVKIKLAFFLNKDKVYPNVFVPEPPEHELYKNRNELTIKKIKTRKDFVYIELFESSKIDHDSISVSVNGHYILTDKELTKEKIKIRVPLEKGINSIVIYAVNEGNIPPNTGTCIITNGRKKTEFPVQTSKSKNAVIEIEKK